MTALIDTWDWEKARARAGVRRNGVFNAGRLPFQAPLYWHNAAGQHVTVSAAELERLVRRIAASLERMQVKRGDRVIGLLGRRPETFAAAIATWRLGAIYVPLFTSFGPEAISVRIEDSQPKAAITDSANRNALGGPPDASPRLEVLVVEGRGAEGDAVLSDASSEATIDTDAEDPATIMYTSGTTSRPKGCVMPHRAVLNLWPFVERCLRLTSADVFFSTADPGWSFGLLTTGLAPLSLGHSRCLFEPEFDATAWWTAMETWAVTHLATAPTGLRQLAAAGDELLGGRSLSLRAVTAAGEPLTPDVVRWFGEKLNVRVCNSYGLSELGMLTANVPAPADDDTALSLGSPLPGFDIRVFDEEGAEVPPGEVGRLAVRDEGQLISVTYWGRDAEWQARVQDGWWMTEDLVRADEDGRLWYVDRSDDVIVTAGYNVSPTEVERMLLDHPLVSDAACVGEPDPRKGQVIAAHVVLRGGPPADMLPELQRLVGERLGWHTAPRRLYVQDQLPRTESGKLRRRDLRRQ